MTLREPEAAFTTWVIDAARAHGFRVAHFRPALTTRGWRTAVQGDGAGFPDCVLVHPTRGVIFAELKTRSGVLSTEQRAWRDALVAAGAEHVVWKPEDRDAVLARLGGVLARVQG